MYIGAASTTHMNTHATPNILDGMSVRGVVCVALLLHKGLYILYMCIYVGKPETSILEFSSRLKYIHHIYECAFSYVRDAFLHILRNK